MNNARPVRILKTAAQGTKANPNLKEAVIVVDRILPLIVSVECRSVGEGRHSVLTLSNGRQHVLPTRATKYLMHLVQNGIDAWDEEWVATLAPNTVYKEIYGPAGETLADIGIHSYDLPEDF
jgi:hypothetical protein